MSKYLVSQVEQWGEELDGLRAPDPGSRKVGKREAVLLLARKLQSAARRGFTTAELLAVLAEKGLEVHVDLLREALRSDAGGRASSGRGGRRKGDAAVRGERRREEAGDDPVESSEASGVPGGSQPAESPGATTAAGPEPTLETTRARGRDAEGKSAAGAPAPAPEETRVRARPEAGVDAGLGTDTGAGSSPVAEARRPVSGSAAPQDGGSESHNGAEAEKAATGAARASAGEPASSGPGRGRTPASEPPASPASRPAGITPAQPAPRGSFTPRDDSDQL